MTDSGGRLAAAGVAVSRLGMGTAPLGGLYAAVPAEQATATVRAALAAGVRLFDTAPLYGAGESERLLGAGLRGAPRGSFTLATKVGRVVEDDGTVRFDFSRDGVLRSVEASLRRLGLDRLDIVHVHDPDQHGRAALEVVLPLLADLRREGAIGAVGAGMNQWQMLAEFAEHGAIDCALLAGRYTLLEQGALPFLELCRRKGVGLFLGGVYNSGILAVGARPGAPYNYAAAPPPVLERVARLEAVCARHGAPLHVAALQFAAAHPAVASVVIGMRSVAEVEAAVAALGERLPQALWDELRSEGLIAPGAPVPGDAEAPPQ